MADAGAGIEPVITVVDGPVSLESLGRLALGGAHLRLSEASRQRIVKGRAVVDGIVAEGTRAYGITVGVGSQKDFTISSELIAQYNRLLLAGHATIAPGPDASPEAIRGALAVQIGLFATGCSGVSLELVERLVERFNNDDLPAARLGSSVGAADIVAMSQLGLPLIGQSGVVPGRGAGSSRPLTLKPKEALSLLCSNALTLSVGALALSECRRLLDTATHVAALSLEGFRGNPASWSALVDAARGQPGQSKVGRALRAALNGSQLLKDGEPRFLQDPLSFRCVPQIHGAAEAAYDFASGLLGNELAAICDNPFVDLCSGTLNHHANCETTACALAFDTLRLALAKVIEASGQRIHKIQWPVFSHLPTGLATEGAATGGVQFLNIAHIATACVGAVCQGANPAMLNFRGQICDGVEDVAGNAPLSIDETMRILRPAWNVLAIEAICAVWSIDRRKIAIDALGQPLRELSARLRSLLPIGEEGQAIFDIGPVVELLKTMPLAGLS